jgi:RNA-directed DNA polymerase
MGHIMEQPNPDDHLLEKILSRDNLITAWKQVKANKEAPGIDDMTIEELPAFARRHWHEILESLMAGTYQPSAVRRVELPKPTGGLRPLGIPRILDRLIQQAIAQVLGPIFDPMFSESSFGFQPDRSAHDAVYQVRRYIQSRHGATTQ